MNLPRRLMFTVATSAALVLAASTGAFAMGGMSGGGGHTGTMQRHSAPAPAAAPQPAQQAGTGMSAPTHGAGGAGQPQGEMPAPGHTSSSGLMDPGQQRGTTMADPGHQPHQPGTGMSDAAGGGHMFGDAAGMWFEDYATHMAENGYMHGYGNGAFGGYDQITRGQFAATMARMLGLDASGQAPFGDTHGYWGGGYVAAMTRAGIISGHADGTFGPNEPITRAQMAALMDRARAYIGEHTPDYDRQQLHDQLMDVGGHWAEDHIGHMYELGVTQGDGSGQFHPDEHTDRAQAATMLWRWHEAQ